MKVSINCLWTALLLSVLLVNGSWGQHHPQSTILLDQILDQQWKDEKALTDIIARFIHNLIVAIKSSSFPTAVAQNISQQCTDDSLLYVHSLYTSLWALQMQESSGQLPMGLFARGNIHADGLFDECLAVRAPNFSGKYCNVYFVPTLVDPSEIIKPTATENDEQRANLIGIFHFLGEGFGYRRVKPKVSRADPTSYIFPSVSLCVPSSCSSSDLGEAVAQLIGRYVFGGNVSIATVTDDNYCFVDNPPPPSFDGPDIAVIVTLSILGAVVLAATAHESWRMYKNKVFDPKSDHWTISALHCFSTLNNGRKILSMKVSTSSDNLSCIHGIRVLSTLWVVIGHTWINGAYLFSLNNYNVREFGMTWWGQGIANATISVDTFLVMGGILVCYLLLKELDRNRGRFNVFLFYLHRYIRLTIVYALVLGFIATLIVYMGTGPNWYNVIATSAGCRVSWWKNFLYINNLFPSGSDDLSALCMSHVWYLALDMQLFIIAPLFIYFLWRWSKWGLLFLLSFTLASIGANFTIFAVFDNLLPTTMLTRTLDLAAQGTDADYYYTKLWTRAPPYMIGIFVGWLLHINKNSRKPIPKVFVILGWILSVGISLAVIYGLVPYLDQATEIPRAVTITYGSLHRTAWACSVAWIIYACIRGYGGFVNRFLSWKGFLPLSRLTYCVYLIHFNYLTVYYAMSRKLIYYTFSSQLTTYLGIVITVFGLAFVVSVTIEASFLNLEKMIFSPKKKNERPDLQPSTKNGPSQDTPTETIPPSSDPNKEA